MSRPVVLAEISPPALAALVSAEPELAAEQAVASPPALLPASAALAVVLAMALALASAEPELAADQTVALPPALVALAVALTLASD